MHNIGEDMQQHHADKILDPSTDLPAVHVNEASPGTSACEAHPKDAQHHWLPVAGGRSHHPSLAAYCLLHVTLLFKNDCE